MSGNYDMLVRAALGQDGLSAVNKFGYNPSITTALETIWSEGGLYAYPSAAVEMTASSSSTDDALAGTGAKQIEVIGLDADYNEQCIIVDMNGQNAVTISSDLIRVNRVKVIDDQDAIGNIYIGTGALTTGKPANVYSKVDIGENQTLQTVYTVPAGKKALLFLFAASSSKNETITVSLKARELGGVFQTKAKIDLYQNAPERKYPAPRVALPMTDIELRAVGTAVAAQVSGEFTVVLIPA